MGVADLKNAVGQTDEVQLTVAGRASSRETSRPVWFVRERDTLYLLPVKGSDSAWFKNVLKRPTVGLAVNDVAVRRRRGRSPMGGGSARSWTSSGRSTVPTR